MRRSGFLWNDEAPTSVVLSGNTSYVVSEAPVRVTAKGLAAGQALPIEVRIFAFDAARPGSQVDYWAPLVRDGAPVALTSTTTQIIETVPGEYRVVVSGPRPFGAPVVISYDEVWGEVENGAGYGMTAGIAMTGSAVGRFLWNDTKPTSVPVPHSTIYNVTDHPIRLVAKGLGTSDALVIETRMRAPDARRPGKELEYWVPLSRNGRPVVLSGANTQIVECIPGTYRVVVPGPRPFGQDLVIGIIDHRPLNVDDVRRTLFQFEMTDKVAAVAASIVTVVGSTSAVTNIINTLTSDPAVFTSFITNLSTSLVSDPAQALALADALTADPAAAQTMVTNLFSDTTVATSIVTNIATTIASDPAAATAFADALTSDPAAAITIVNNLATAIVSDPAAAQALANAITSDPAAAQALVTNLFSDPATAALFLSTDAGNKLTLGADNRLFFSETITAFAYDPATTVLTYTDEAGNTTTVDLSALTSDIYVNGGTFDPASLMMTLTDTSGATPNITVDLSTLLGVWTPNGDGTYVYDSGNGSTFTMDIRAANLPYANTTSGLTATTVQAAIDELSARPAGISTDAGNQLVNGTDGRPYFTQTLTAFAYDPATHVASHTNEAGTTTTADLSGLMGVSADVGNQLVAGTDGKPFFTQTITSLTYTPATTVLAFKDEAGNITTIDLSALTSDIYVNGATFDPASLVLTLTDNDGATPNVTVDLSDLLGSWTPNGDGTYTYDAGNGSTFTMDIRAANLPYANATSGLTATSVQAAIDELSARPAGISTDVGNQLVNGTDGRPYFTQTLTAFAYNPATHVASHTDEAGTTTTADLSGLMGVSTDAGNQLVAGTDSKPFFTQTVTSLSYDPVTTTLSFVDEAGNTTTVSLAALAADIYVNGASFNPASLALTLTDNGGATPDVTVDLSDLLGSWTPNGDGTYTYDAGNGSTFTLDIRAANLPYANATSGLAATTVQAAIDELADAAPSVSATAPGTSTGASVPTTMTGTTRALLLADPDGWYDIGGKKVPFWN